MAVIVAVVLLLAGHVNASAKGGAEWEYGNIPSEQKEMWWLFGKNQIRFWTNDPDGYEKYFVHALPPIPDKAHVFEITANKWSGAASFGYGMVFCYDSDPIVHNNGMGLAASVGRETSEKFPAVPVEVLFRY